jgi:hypothetical protein
MIQQKLEVGRYLNFPSPTPQPLAAGAAAVLFDFVSLQPMPLHIDESTGVFTKVSAVSAGAHATKGHRNFNWLEYRPGYITEVPLTTDVITGPMSGCFLVIYRRAGAYYAGHIGTADSDRVFNSRQYEKDEINDAVKNTWNTFARAHPGDLVGGFNPLRGLKKNVPPKKNDESAVNVFGVMTTTNLFYAMALYTQTSNTAIKRIGLLEQIAPIPPDDLVNIL